MSGTEGRPERRARPPRPRVAELDALLREVDDLRLTLETDLTLAASAVESGAPDVAVEILDADRLALQTFESRSLDQLAALEAAPQRRGRLVAHAGPVLVAAAVIGVLTAVLPRTLNPQTPVVPETVAVTKNLQKIQDLTAHGTPGQVRAASEALHAQLATVVENAREDPAAAQTALLLLTYEQSAIVTSGDSAVLADVLSQSQALARRIRAALPPVHPTTPALPGPTASPSPSPSATKSSPKPKPSSSPNSSASPSPSRDSDPYPLPSAPTAP